MGAADAAKSIKLTLRLLRVGRSVENSLREDHELDEVECGSGRLFIGQSDALPPSWYGFVRSFANAEMLRLVTQSASAVLFLEVPLPGNGRGTRSMAVSFGGGHHALEPDAFERNFGLRVTLNSVARSNLRSMDIATLDATTFQKRIQASRDADLQGFGIDVDRDLLRLAAGSPRDKDFARSLAGKDALTLTAKIAPEDLIDKCKAALKVYLLDDYKKEFGWIDNVTLVHDRGLIDSLDDAAFTELNALVKGRPSDLHIALPDIISPEEGHEIGYFGIGLRPGQKHGYSQLAIEDYVAELQGGRFDEIADMRTLKGSHEARVVVDGEGDRAHKRKLYDCFVFETEKDRQIYVLFGGDWFQVQKTFREAVETGFKRLLADPFVAGTVVKDERAFIAELDADPALLNLDQVKLNPAGTINANLEPCDFLSRRKQFIHLKDGHSSAPISHLWNQGLVSAESFVRDETFRRELRKAAVMRQRKAKKAGFEKLLPDGRQRPVPADFTVVFGIMRERYKKSGEIGLPFFSMVSLRSAASRIEMMGFRVEVHLIEKKKLPAKASVPRVKAA